jgi:hypothetical protein
LGLGRKTLFDHGIHRSKRCFARKNQVSPHDPVAFGGAILLMMSVALISCLLPACRVVRIDPARALRA